MKFNGPKVKLSRRLGIALTPKAARIMAKKPYPPGQHGQARRRRLTKYAEQLLEKQRLKAQYNVSERHLRKLFKKASSKKGVAGDNLVTLLECRLDALFLRAGLAQTIYQARQNISHGHVILNGKRCNIASCALRTGDSFSVAEGSRKIPSFNQPRSSEIPPYLSLHENGYGGELQALPQRSDVPVICNVRLVVEFYSR